VLEKNGKDQFDGSCEKRSITKSQEGEYSTNKERRKASWIGHTLRRNCILRHVIKGKIEGRTEVTGRQCRRRKKLQDSFEEKRGYGEFKEEALDHTLWRTRFGKDYGSVVRQTKE